MNNKLDKGMHLDIDYIWVERIKNKLKSYDDYITNYENLNKNNMIQTNNTVKFGDIYYDQTINRNIVANYINSEMILKFPYNFKFIGSGKTYRIDENNKVWETIHKGQSVFKPFKDPLTPKECFEKGSDFDIDKKDDYQTLKEKCIELECKRLGVDKLNFFQNAGFQLRNDFKDVNQQEKYMILAQSEINKMKQDEIVKMKKYIDRVEKELKDKESIPPIIQMDSDALKSNNINITNCFFKSKQDDKNILFHFTKEGLKVNLDGYAIIPLEEYNNLIK